LKAKKKKFAQNEMENDPRGKAKGIELVRFLIGKLKKKDEEEDLGCSTT